VLQDGLVVFLLCFDFYIFLIVCNIRTHSCDGCCQSRILENSGLFKFCYVIIVLLFDKILTKILVCYSRYFTTQCEVSRAR